MGAEPVQTRFVALDVANSRLRLTFRLRLIRMFCRALPWRRHVLHVRNKGWPAGACRGGSQLTRSDLMPQVRAFKILNRTSMEACWLCLYSRCHLRSRYRQ